MPAAPVSGRKWIVTNQTLLAAAFLALALGCVHPREFSVATVGPAPSSHLSGATNGTLVVYSAWRKTGTDDTDHPVHSSYDVLTESGQAVQHVRNYVTPILDEPASISLAPGKYVVRARVQRYGFVSVPVVLEPHKTTVLYMDDTTKPDSTGQKPIDPVKLPDGRVIGWASAAAR